MHRYTKLLLASLTATALLAIAVGTASAGHLSTSNQNFRVTWTSLELTNTINNEVVLCEVTLEGSFHSATIAKTSGLLVGYVTRANLAGGGREARCTGGSATIHQETLPWHIRYRGFTGTLPNPSGVVLGLIGVSFEIRTNGGFLCNASTEALKPAVGTININTTTHVAESLRPDETVNIPLEGGFCFFGSGRFRNTSQTLTLLGTTTRITVTLI